MKDSPKIRHPAVAGQFYDDDPLRLRAEILSYLEAPVGKTNPSPREGRPIALVAPHAGYVYSGRTAAKAFSLLEGWKYKRAIVIAPSHRYRMHGLAYGDFDSFDTPLGTVAVDKDALAKIAEACPAVQEAGRAHSGEHSLEVELPFLQIVQPELPMVPFICGTIDDALADSLSDAMLGFLGGENIWIISSDFTHYGQAFGYLPFLGGDIAAKIRKLDMGAVEKILALDYAGFRDYIDETGATICGENPIKILLRTAQKVSGKPAKIATELVAYANSGDMSGDYSHCVSYASIAFSQKSEVGQHARHGSGLRPAMEGKR